MRSFPPHSGDPRRQVFFLKVVIGILLITALVLLILPLRIPRPLRLFLVSTELIAAGAIWLLTKARLNG